MTVYVTFLHYFTFDPLLHFRNCVNRYGTPDALYGIRVPLIDPTASAATIPVFTSLVNHSSIPTLSR